MIYFEWLDSTTRPGIKNDTWILDEREEEERDIVLYVQAGSILSNSCSTKWK